MAPGSQGSGGKCRGKCRFLPVEVLGRWVGPELRPNEIGYRVRLLGGEEITLVREPLAQWCADPGAALQ